MIDVATFSSDLTVFDERNHAAKVWLQHLLDVLMSPSRQQLLQTLRLLAVIRRPLLSHTHTHTVTSDQ